MDPNKIFKQLKNEEPSPEFHKNLRRELETHIKAFPASSLDVASGARHPWSTSTRAFAAGVLVFVLAGGVSAVFAAQNSLPGEFLYPAKLLAEKTEIAMAKTPIDSADLRIKFSEKRISEIQKLITNEPKLSPRSRSGIVSALADYKSQIKEAAGKADLDDIKSKIQAKISNDKARLFRMIEEENDNEIKNHLKETIDFSESLNIADINAATTTAASNNATSTINSGEKTKKEDVPSQKIKPKFKVKGGEDDSDDEVENDD